MIETQIGRITLDSKNNRIGEIVLLDFPYTNTRGYKLRPALIVAADDIQNDFLVAFVTSEIDNYKWSEFAVVFKQNDLQSGSVRQESIIRCDKLITISPDRILRNNVARLKNPKISEVLRKLCRIGVNGIYRTLHQSSDKEFIPGKSRVNYAGRVFDENELVNSIDASLDFWLTEGRFAQDFSEKISEFLGIGNVILTNSGSSANLLALTALTSEKLGDKRLKPGDEVITVAAGFPSTISPIIQNNLIPVFVDVEIPTYNISIEQLEKAISPKTKCIFIAHTLGNPFDLDEVLKLTEKHGLWLIEDNCDAFGSKYRGKYTGTFGHLATISFYPAHHITTGEGGAVVTDDDVLASIIRSFRDWGRDCYCAGGENNTCGKRFGQQFGGLPQGYDHKYVYSEIGYNLKMTDIQAAIGSAQMDKLPLFCETRKTNFKTLASIFSPFGNFFILPEATGHSEPAWFSFIVTVRETAPFTRDGLVNYFNNCLIETRSLFAGNIIKQPAYQHVTYKVSGSLQNTDYIMNNTFFLGTYPGLTSAMFDYIESKLKDFLSKFE